MRIIVAPLAALVFWSHALAQPVADLPRIESRDGRHALMVDGAPFLMLGAQANNSSNYPAPLKQVWPVLDRIGANTLEMPVAWEQVEPLEGQFDFSFVQTLIDAAKAHDRRIVLLWFGAYKNTGLSYTPAWVKRDNRRFPRMKTPDGRDHDVLSPHGAATLASDRRAFVALMTYVRDHDPTHRIIMVQPENETGSYTNPRDYGPQAQRLFDGPVPERLTRALGKGQGNWRAVFGDQADRAFNTWHTARYVEVLAAAGKAVKPLPMYVNAALASDPFTTPDATRISSGGPQGDVIAIWKAAAPSIDVEAPDIYDRASRNVMRHLDLYARPDNPLMIPEIGNAREYARYFWAALGRGAIGFAPFGMDDTGYFNHPLGAKALDNATLDAFAVKYRFLAEAMRPWAQIAFTHPTWGVARPDDGTPVMMTMGDWTIAASFGEWQFGRREWFAEAGRPASDREPIGGGIVAQLAPDTFLIAGDHVRLAFAPRAGGQPNGMLVRAEEGHFEGDRWIFDRVWNGDQTDYGLNFTDRPVWVKVTMGHYR